MCVGFCGFFFFKQKTAYEMRISDWSSDVCSSDLAFRGGWVHDELYAVRDSRPAFRWGLLAGTVYSGIELWLRGRTPWTLRHRHADHETLRQASASKPIAYPKPDGVLTFDRLRSEEHTSELQSLMRTSYAVFCLKNKNTKKKKRAQTN